MGCGLGRVGRARELSWAERGVQTEVRHNKPQADVFMQQPKPGGKGKSGEGLGFGLIRLPKTRDLAWRCGLAWGCGLAWRRTLAFSLALSTCGRLHYRLSVSPKATELRQVDWSEVGLVRSLE